MPDRRVDAATPAREDCCLGGRMGKKRSAAGPKAKKINVELITDFNSEPYKLLSKMRKENHDEIRDAKIALAWRTALKPDVDGHLVLGRCVKASDLQRELAAWDFVIVLNKEMWEAFSFEKETATKRREALLDHELCHAALVLDKWGEPKVDEKGRKVFRIRKHDIEEFRGVVARHGCYKRDLEQFAEAVLKSRQGELTLSAAK